MQEVGLDHVRHEGRVLLLEHDGDYVVAYVPLPLQLDGTETNKTNNSGNISNNQLEDQKHRPVTESLPGLARKD